MNREETANLLTAMASLDRRTIGAADVIAWHGMVEDIAFEDGLEAVKRHYREHTEWIMPAHVRRLVGEILKERDDAARATGYAPGQYGVPKEHPMPEIKPGGPYELMRDVSVADADVAELLAALRSKLPEGSRAALMGRRVAWEQEHRAYVRVRDSKPNPLYKPTHDDVAAISELGSDDYNPYVKRAAGEAGDGETYGIGCDQPGHPRSPHICARNGVPYPASYYDTQATAGPSGEPTSQDRLA